MSRKFLRALIAPVSAAVAAVVISSIALLIAGKDPIEAFREMWKTIDSTQSVTIIINNAVPLYISGVAVAIGFKMNLFNIGSNGQYLLAALIAGWAGAEVSLPPLLHVPFVFLVAMVVGGSWALIAAILNVTRNVNVVISTIMLNYIAIGLSAFLLSELFRDEENGGLVAQTKEMPASAQLPPLNALFEWFGFNFGEGVELYGFLPFAIALGIGYYILLNRSRFGYDLRLSGSNPEAALSSGVNPKKMVLITLFMSGAVAGMIGLPYLMADPDFHKYGDAFPTGLGFTGLGIALLGRNNPAGIAAAAIVWATIERATQRLGPIGVPPEIGRILAGSFLLVAVIAYEVAKRRNDAAATAAAAQATHDERLAAGDDDDTGRGSPDGPTPTATPAGGER
ncbi:MAG: ABC transporter permease [Actinomycetota bacterium]